LSNSVTWDATFEAAPAGGDALSLGDNKLRELKLADRERQQKEHKSGVAESNAKQGWHREGSARAFVAGTEPTAYENIDATAIGGDATIDDGRLFFDLTQALLPKVHSEGTWQGFLRELARVSIQGTLATGTDVAPPMVFPRAGTITKITAAVGTVPVGSAIIVDVNIDGTTIFSHANSRLTIDTTVSQASSVDITTALLVDQFLTFDIDQVGSTTPGSDIGITVEVVVG